jgi:hypothetical protein
MGRPELPATAAWGAKYDWAFNLTTKHIVDLGGVVNNSIKGKKSEIDGHELSNRTKAVHRRAGGCTANNHLSDGGISNAFLAEFVVKTSGYRVGSAPDANLLSHDEYILVAFHFLAKRVGNRLSHRDI